MKRIYLYLSGVGVALLGIWLVLWVAVGSQLPPKSSLLGIDISRLSSQQATTKISAELDKKLAADITLSIESKEFALKRVGSAITLDIPASISNIHRRSWNPITLATLFFRAKSAAPIIRTSQEDFDRAIQVIERKVNTSPQNADIIYKGTTPQLVRSAPGKWLPRKAALRKIASEWLRVEKIELSLREKAPRISDAQAEKLMEFAKNATSAPVQVTLQTEKPVTLTVTPAVIAQSLSFIPGSQGELNPKWLRGTFVNAMGSQWTSRVVEPVNASFIMSGGEPRVQPSHDGFDVPEQKLNDAFVIALGKSGMERSVSLALEPVPAKITTEMAGGLGIKEVIGSFTTYYPYAEYRITNIHRAARWMDGVIVKPGEIFSYNKAVGERTEARGFVPGIMIDKGVFKKDWGGGVSQVATTTWNAAWFSGLELIQHKPHSFYISRYPPGRESTVAWPSIDVKFRNNSGNPIFVDTSYTNKSVTVTIYGTKFVDVETETGQRTNPVKFTTLENDAEECLFQEGVSGFTIDVWRILKRDGVELKREKYRTRYRPEDRIICTNPKARWMNPPLSVQRSLTS